jgi:hypothetical protein
MITDTAIYRNRNYRTAGDTPDTLSYPRMAEVVAGVAELVRVVAGRNSARLE